MVKILLQFFKLFVFGTIFGLLDASNSPHPCLGWIAYKDEKCFRVLDGTFGTFDEAEKMCNDWHDTSTLPIIDSKEEQEFLANYLFKALKRTNNFWLEAKFSKDAFHWNDNTELKYTNWDNDGPNQKVNYCVQMQSDEGKWITEPCEQKNVVICQRLQTWSNALLQKKLLEARKESRDKIAKLEQNPVPLGFVYVQFASQPDPNSLWPAVEWTDATSEYSGLFFRAEGADSAQFGTIQGENAPRITQVQLEGSYPNEQGVYNWVNTSMTGEGWSSGMGVFAGSYDGNEAYVHRFYQSGGEVRPRNSAIRIWKRTN